MTMMMMDDDDDRFVTRLRAETRQLAQHVAREVGPSEAGLNANAAARGERGFSSRVSSRCDVARGFPVHFVDWSLVSVLRRRSCSCGQVLCVSAAARRWLGCAAHLAPCRPGGAATWLLGLASAARRFSAAVGGRLGSSAAAPQLGGSAVRSSAARWLGCSVARRLVCSVAWRLSD